MLYTSRKAPPAAFFQNGLWYVFFEGEGYCLSPGQLKRRIRLTRRTALRGAAYAGRALANLRGSISQSALGAKAELSEHQVSDLELGDGLEFLTYADHLVQVLGSGYGAPELLSQGPMSASDWRIRISHAFRQARGEHGIKEIEALSDVPRSAIESLLECGDDLEPIRWLRDCLEALRLYFDVRPPEGFDSLAEYIWSEATR